MKALKLMMVVLAVGAFSVSAFAGVGPPAYDECTGAVAPGTEVDNSLCTAGGTDVEGSCWSGTAPFLTAWYMFEAAGDQIGLATDLNSTATDSCFAVFGECPPVTEVGCSEDEARYYSPWLGAICLTNLTPAATYYVELASWTTGAAGPFVLDAFINKDACGNQVLDDPCEECESDTDCPTDWACNLSTCKCWNTIPTLPVWGLVGLGVLLVAGGGMVFGRRRTS